VSQQILNAKIFFDRLDLERPARTVYQADARVWLADHAPLMGCSVVTSMPDFSEFKNISLSEWQTWFSEMALDIFCSVPMGGLVCFYQTDIKRDGVWIDKTELCQRAALKAGYFLLEKKIFCRVPPGVVSGGAVGFSTLSLFGKTASSAIENSAGPDVSASAGDKTWTRGMGTAACEAALSYIKINSMSRTILDPFCGHGTVLAVANALGFDAIGVDIKKNCVERSRLLNFQIGIGLGG
jgi:hypothetical protein